MVVTATLQGLGGHMFPVLDSTVLGRSLESTARGQDTEPAEQVRTLRGCSERNRLNPKEITVPPKPQVSGRN